MKAWTIGTCLMAGLLAVGSGVGVYAAHGADDGGEARPLHRLIHGQLGRLITLHSEMDVTSEQRRQIHDIVGSHRQEIAAVAKPIVEKRRALREATLAANPDEAAIRAAASDLGKSIGDAAVLASKVKPEVFRVLTPEQQKKVEAFRADSESAVDRFLHDMTTVQ